MSHKACPTRRTPYPERGLKRALGVVFAFPLAQTAPKVPDLSAPTARQDFLPVVGIEFSES